MTVYIHLAGIASQSKTIEKFDDSGNNTALWTANHGDLVYAVKVDSQGNVYTGGLLSGGYTLRKYDKDGNFLWGANTGERIYCLGIDSQDNVYTGGLNYTGHNCCKYNSGGTKQWGFDEGRNIWAIAIDNSDDIYFAGEYSGYDIKKVSASKSTLWTRTYHKNTIYALAVDIDKNIYLAGDRQLDTIYKNIRKYNSAGTEQWSADHGVAGAIYAIDLDADGNLYAGGNAVSSVTTRKYDSSGTEIITGWRKNNKAEVRGLAVNKSDNTIYTTGVDFYEIPPSARRNTRKYNSSGTELYKIGTNFSRQAICVVNLDTITAAPAIAIDFSIDAPFQSNFISIPPVSIDFSIGVPVIPPVIFAPDLTGQVYYTLIITGESDLLYLPLVDLQCVRRLGASTWLTVTTLIYDDTQVDDIIARCNNNAQIAVYASSGTEAGEFIRANVSEFEITKTRFSARAALKARVVPVAFTRQTRALRSVISITDDGGRRHAKCAIDFLLRPNDTVNDGQSEWVAGTILYKITADDAFMIVDEIA